MEENKSYYVSIENSEKINQDINLAYKEIDNLNETLTEIYKTLEKLEPQQKLFFLEKLLTDIIMRSNMPIFFLNGLLSKISDFLKSLDGEGIKEEMQEKNHASYLG